MRDVDNLRAKYTHETQHFLTFSSRARGNGDQRHFSFDVRARGYVLHLAHSRQPFALFDDLLDSAFVAARNNSDARPAWIETFTDRDRFDVESARAEQPDDSRQLSRLVSHDYRQRMPHAKPCV